MHKTLDEFKYRPDTTTAFDRLKKKDNVVNTQAPSALFGSSSFLQVHVTRTTIKSWINWKFSQIQPLTVELPAFERLKSQCIIM